MAGVFITDPATRASVVDTVSGVFPPLRELATSVLDEASRESGPVSILGLVTLLWGASRFAVAFQDAIARVTGGTRRRSFLRSNAGAFGAVLLLVLAILASTILAGLSAFLDAGQSIGIVAVLDRGVGLALGILPILAAIVAVAVVYRFVPVFRPGWRSVLMPAVVVGLVLTALARAFVFISPRLIGAAALLGTLASVFAALAWLSLSFQALLVGAAWMAERNASAEAGEPGAPTDARPLPTEPPTA